MNNNKKLRIGLVGIGRMGKNHFEILSILNSVEIIFINDLKKSELLGKKSNFVKTLTVDNLKLIDAIIICTPTSTHFNLIKKVARQVKNIFIEKPLAQNFNETIKIIKYAKKNRLNLKVGFIERFNPVIENFFGILKKKEKIICLDFVRAGPTNIKDADVVTDLMVHDIDLSILISGKVKKVQSFSYKDKNLISHSCVNLEHYNGTISRFLASRLTQKKIRTMNVTLKNKYIECDLLKRDVKIFAKTRIKDRNKNFIFKSNSEILEPKQKEPLLLELQDFINNCLGKNKKLLADFKESHEVMRIADEIKKQSKL